MQAGRLNMRLTFMERAAGNDNRGNTRTGFVDRFEAWADMRLRPGSETFAAARLEGRVPYSVMVRRNAETAQITTGWRARDEDQREYDVQAPGIDPHDRGALHMMLILNAGTP